jgi:methylated-DNA-[protein]-cysteine S-methyltransferase
MQTTPSGFRYNMVLDSPLGRLGVICRDRKLVRIDYLTGRVALNPASTPFEREISGQLAGFFKTPAHRFTLALDMQGTDFQRRVWQALTCIPAGQTLTYGELAAQLDSGARAVGNACRNNPVSIVVPCHRVVSAAGIGGYSGKTDGREIGRKQWLLRHEGNTLEALKTRPQTPNIRIYPNNQRILQA